jgi:DNA processing protein
LAGLGPRVAIVGSRNATSYGLEAARTIAGDLAAAGVCVVSGMARGIDRAAHEGALSVRGRTIAVLAGGVDVPYPASSTAVYPDIVRTGAVVSEEPLGADHRPENFLKRNRIIAALSLGVVLVQADPRRSGALTTARWAIDLGRELFAVPGDIRSVLSGGPHDHLRRGRAHVCTEARDVLEVLGGELADTAIRSLAVPEGLDPDEHVLIEAVNAGPARVDELAARAGLDVVMTQRALTRLELAGLVVRADGSYRRTR